MGLTSFITEHSADICERYADGVARAKSKASLAALLDINVLEWLCMMEPAHKSSRWLTGYFGNFVSGGFTKQCEGYSCAVWSGFTGEVTLDADVTALVGCKAVTVFVPDHSVKRVFASGGIVEVVLGEKASLHLDITEGTEVAGLVKDAKTTDVSGNGIEIRHIKHYG